MSDKKGFDKELEIKAQQKYENSAQQEYNAREWIESITGETIGEDFWLTMKNGVILCKLIKVISPSSIGRFDEKPKHYLEEKANINRYLEACRKIGMPEQDMMDPLDMSDSRKDPLALLTNIYAVARQAQAIGFNGPSLGVRYYKTVGDQERIKARREEDRRLQEQHMERRREAQRVRRDELEEEKKARVQTRIEGDKSRLRERKQLRKAKGQTDLVQHPSVRSEAELHRSISPVRYGMDLETQKRKEDTYDYSAENAALDWIEEVTQEEVDSIYLHLKSGRTLCNLANKLHKGIIKKTNKGKMGAQERENIANFRIACQQLGVKEHEIFDVNDLYKQEDLGAVVKTIHALSRAMERNPSYKGKLIKRDMNTIAEVPSTEAQYSHPPEHHTGRVISSSSRGRQSEQFLDPKTPPPPKLTLKESLPNIVIPITRRAIDPEDEMEPPKSPRREPLTTRDRSDKIEHPMPNNPDADKEIVTLEQFEEMELTLFERFLQGAVLFGGIILGLTVTYCGYYCIENKRIPSIKIIIK